MKRPLLFRLLFVLAAVANLSAGVFDWPLIQVVSKSMLVPSLIGYYLVSVERSTFLFTLALLFCWAGDVLLIFQQRVELFFIFGLLAFLIGHLLYIGSYRRFQWSDRKNALMPTQKIRFSLPVILAGTGLIAILFPTLGSLKVPVLIYALVLILMVMTALFRYGRTTTTSFWLVFAGAGLFMISDSTLAINKFYAPVHLGGLWIMLTYITAQYLIVEGVVRHKS